MERFDVIVIGAGSGLHILDGAVNQGLRVALVEKGPMGGTCLNRGCIPSKMLLHSADVLETMQTAARFNITPGTQRINFPALVKRISSFVDKDARELEQKLRGSRNITLFKAEGKFVGPRTVKVGKSTIAAGKVFIFAGTRPAVPKIEGLGKIKFLTSDEALRLGKLPKSLAILGGGYIAAELAHYFGTLGTKVTIIEQGKTLIQNEDSEIAEAFTAAFGKKHKLLLNSTVNAVSKKGGRISVMVQSGRKKQRVIAEQLLVAAGRTPNSDILDLRKAGVDVNERGYIRTNDYLETTAPGVWAGGDIAGKFLFKHSANLEADYLYNNAFTKKSKEKVDYHAMPHVIFSSPQVAGVGLRGQDLPKGSYALGKYFYRDTGMGAALMEEDGFVKILVDRKTRRILGAHIIGPEAATLIHEVVVAMRSGSGTIDNITKAVHVHPALSEVVQRAALSVEF